MNTLLIDKLQEKVNNWRRSEYAGVYKETANILNHIRSVNFLYKPQIEALETYIYIKEILNNPPTNELVNSLFESKEKLIEELPISDAEKYQLIKNPEDTKKMLEEIYGEFSYPNQVYALTMGSGKTILMATMILYEFVLSTRHPEDKRFAKNTLVFAPDKTIIESLKEIKSFNYDLVIPKEYRNVSLNIKYYYLESTETAVNFIGNYNIVVSNSQKIIMKRRRTVTKDQMFLLNESTRNKEFIVNSRLNAIRSLENLTIFVDEAHHTYGSTGIESLEKTLKSSRETIKHINEEGKTPLVNVVNLTGTPYVNNTLIKDVVYHFGLKQGIESGILKQVQFFEYENVKSKEFIEQVVHEFTKEYGENRLEGKLPKIAFYASNISDLQQNLRPALETVLAEKNISLDKVIEYHTEKDENSEAFKALDTPESSKQFVLLVGRGTEGWNVRSLVATALYRKPKSSIFVLQSSTRCMRSIGDNSTPASIFLSDENARILDEELQKNFATSRADLERQENKENPLTLNVLKKRKLLVKKELRELEGKVRGNLDKVTLPSIKSLQETHQKALKKVRKVTVEEESKKATLHSKEWEELELQRGKIPAVHLISQLSVKTHLPYLTVKEILIKNGVGFNELENIAGNNNEALNLLAENILSQVYEYKPKVKIIEEEIELTKNFPFKLSIEKGKKELVVYKEDTPNKRLGFHINPYAFDTTDEQELFTYLQTALDKHEVIVDVYFTGNISDITHTDFYFEYWNPRKQKISRYFPDFLVETNTGRYLVIEVKGDDKRVDYNVNKDSYKGKLSELTNEVFAKEVGFRDFQKINQNFDYHIIFNARLQQQQRKLYEQIQTIIK